MMRLLQQDPRSAAPFRVLILAGCDVIDDPVIPLTIAYSGEAEPPCSSNPR